MNTNSFGQGINIGSKPYVFKICGQLHHLMGLVLQSKGKCPKYAQLYICDTRNEISNPINAIDPSHVNQKIKPDVVKGLVQILDDVNKLTKEFRNVKR